MITDEQTLRKLLKLFEEAAPMDDINTVDDLIDYPKSADIIDKDGFILPNHPSYDVDKHIVSLINDITINTLSGSVRIESNTANTLYTLHTMKRELSNGNKKTSV